MCLLLASFLNVIVQSGLLQNYGLLIDVMAWQMSAIVWVVTQEENAL
jgi:hypothetical protein